MDPTTGLPSDELDPVAVELMRALGSTATSVSQVQNTFRFCAKLHVWTPSLVIIAARM